MYVMTFSSSSIISQFSGGTNVSGRRDLRISLLSRESTDVLAPTDRTWSRLKRKASISFLQFWLLLWTSTASTIVWRKTARNKFSAASVKFQRWRLFTMTLTWFVR
ncbi:hypothetical protein PoB_001462400 [Plakobranchus ocellatus]|uniref:Uncharacterized protein n=1 Tax=Plakobranchus ocellatus TaxID=259542 RepID=A0AAV3Z226_9GAST|nr:hypothetical protein PoB_001462400 [Plakobranchus ocellatus]